MSKLVLYHGSTNIIEKPEFGKGKPYNDYGPGFYCTESVELAREWACNENTDGYANRYILETDGLEFLNLSNGEYSVLNWLSILMDNRNTRINSPVELRGREYLIENFLPDYSGCDVIVGYRADDSYFAFARAFVANSISLAQLSRAMTLGKLGEQVVLKSKNVFERVTFQGVEVASNDTYYPKRKSRDEEARAAYRKDVEKGDLEGIFMRDIIREGMKSDDLRLR